MLSGSKSFVFEFACWCHEVFIIVVDIGQWHAPNNKRTKTMEIAVWFCICADEGGGAKEPKRGSWQQASGAGAIKIKMRRLENTTHHHTQPSPSPSSVVSKT